MDHFSGLATVRNLAISANVPVFASPTGSAAATDASYPLVHDRVFPADRVHVSCTVDFRSRRSAHDRLRSRRCRNSRSSSIVACQSGGRIRYRFAFRRLSGCGFAQHAKRHEYEKGPHCNPCLQRPRHNTASAAGRIVIIQPDQRVCLISFSKMHAIACHVHCRACNFYIVRMTERAARRATAC
ncbi:hypothetical protein SAMN05444158_1565 [Bradyrhizobium canariense]|uniref:Uncharacterized protein n=1 Tax=Bradyrhizobium canariense TaxID=255045 RepID=A0A1H1QX46_9BRAD|nr:hypothetical protein SAMN05444158_1565 [Bradyrhizobium canariense]